MRRSFSSCILTTLLLAGLTHTACADDEPTPHSIIDRALKAGGGADKIKQYHAVSFKGEWKFEEHKSKISGVFARPDLFRLEAEQGDESFILVRNGNKLWLHSIKDRTTDEIACEDGIYQRAAALAFAAALPDMLLALKSNEFELKLVQPTPAEFSAGIRIRRADCLETTLYFDQKTGLPAEAHFHHEHPDLPVRVTYSHYKTITDVQHFTRMEICIRGDSQITLSEITLHKSIASSVFKKPGD